MEQFKGSTERNLQKKIKETVGQLGIAGEVTFESPARSIEELLNIAIGKNYNTIVAVGSDRLINRIVPFICNKDITLGIIPINCSPIIGKIVNLEKNNIQQACTCLKNRHVKTVDMAYLYPNRFFLTQAVIKCNRPTPMIIQIDQCKTEANITDLLIISPAINNSNEKTSPENTDDRLNLFLKNKNHNQSMLSKSLNWLSGKTSIDNNNSIFKAKKIIIETTSPQPVYIDDQIVDKTPVMFVSKPKALKIIINHDKIDNRIITK